MKERVLRWPCSAWVLWKEGFLHLYIQAQNCLVIRQLGFSVLRTLWSVLYVTLCTFHFLQQIPRLPTSPRPSPEFIVPGCLHDKHSELMGNDTLGARFNHFSSVVIYVDIRFLGDFKCFSCFLRLLGMSHTYLLRLASGKSSWFAFFPLLLLPPNCFLWAQGPSQPFRPCEDSVPRSSAVTIVVTQSVHKAAALSTPNSDCWGKLSPTGSGLPGLSLGMSWARKTPEGFCLPRASFSALTVKTSLKACIEVPWRVWSCLGEALETRKLHSESPSPEDWFIMLS